VSLADIESSGFQSFLDRYPPHLAKATPFSEALGSSSHGDSGRDSPPDMVYELHVPAPSHLRREEAFRYHVTTRNFFAWMYDLPVVGDQLGGALIALLERLNTFRQNKKQNEEDILAYLSGQDYLDFRECPDHSLAILNLAEACQRRDLWTDAFVHCAGMYDELTFSGEFEVSPCSRNEDDPCSHEAVDISPDQSPHATGSSGNGLEVRARRKITQFLSRGRLVQRLPGARKRSPSPLGALSMLPSFILPRKVWLLAARSG
jgi:hypothetical protein